jgi:hypothetical protein
MDHVLLPFRLHSPSRCYGRTRHPVLSAGAVSAAYFLAASRGLPQGVANFYGFRSVARASLLWFAASIAFVAVHAVLLDEGNREWGGRCAILAAAALMGLPPFGIVGWAHPLTAAGVLFPRMGMVGLAAAAAGLVAMTTRWWPAAAMAMAGFWLWSVATWTAPSPPQGWAGVDLELGQSLGRDATLERHLELLGAVKRKAGEGARVVVLPESALGFWTPTVERLWRDELRGSSITVIAGARSSAMTATTMCWSRFRPWAQRSSTASACRSPSPCGSHGAAGLASGRRPGAHLRQSGVELGWRQDRAADLLRAAHPLAGAAIRSA